MHGYKLDWTVDLGAVKQVIETPEVFNYVMEDESELILPPPSDYVKYALVTLTGNPVGAFVFNKRLKGLWEVHTCLTLACRSKVALSSARSVIAMLFRDTDAECLTTYVPETYLHVRNFTQAVGLTHSGYIPCSFLRNGKFQGMHYYYITREAAICQLLQ